MALFGYLRLTNMAGNMVEGDCRIEGHEKWVPVWGGGHAVQLPTNQDGLPNGKRVHFPLTVYKHVDRTTPVLHAHLNSGDLLKEVVIDWYRVNTKTSQTEAYFRQTLTNIQVTSIDVSMKHQPPNDEHDAHEDDGATPHSEFIEAVQFTYENIIWTYIDGGVEFEDDVKPKPVKPAPQKPQKPVKEPHYVLWQPQSKDKLPVPSDYRATLLIYNTSNDFVLGKQSHGMAQDIESRTFKLTAGEQFEAYAIEPQMQSVQDDLAANRNIKQSVSDGVIAPITLKGSDVTQRGDTMHYAPVEFAVERQVQLLLKHEHTQDITFELKGSSTLSQSIAANQKQKAPLNYGPLDGTESFALNGFEDGLPPVEIIPSIPLADWLELDALRSHNIGSKGGPQLLEHKLVKGHIPQLTFAPAPPQFGLFFDGTGNNKTNDNVDVNDDKEPTNIAKLSELYVRNSFTSRHYEEGIGTKAHEKDRDIDMGTAYSLDEHINNALREVKKHFQQFENSKTGFIDIFGFSRGAAQARMMVNVIHHLNEAQPDYWGGPKLVVRFVGLFDSVGSIGISGDNDNEWCFATGDLPGSPDSATLDINPNAACAVYHLMALDEQRENFPVSSLKASKNGALPKHFIEEGVPGAHADVGGGYGNGESIIHYPLQKLDYFKREATPQRLAADKQRLKQELETTYYRPGIHIEFKESSWVDHSKNRDTSARKMGLKPYWKRQVSNQLALIYLEAMHKKALSFGVPLDPLTELDNFKHSNKELLYKYDTPAALEQLCQQAVSQGVGSQAYQALSEHYIHHSHKYVGLKDSIAHGPESKPKHPFGHYGREVFYAENSGLGDQDTWDIHTNPQGIKQWYKT